MHEAAVRTSAESEGSTPHLVRRSGVRRPAGRRSGRGGGRPGGRPPSGLLPLIVLLTIVTAVSGVVMLLYVDNTDVGAGPGSRNPRQATEPSPTPPECPIPGTHSPRVIETVYRVGRERDVHRTVMLAAFEAGWVESHMRNLDCGDRDSIGVFQQRPSQGWGKPKQLRNIRYAATQFFRKAEREHRHDPSGTAGDLAQRVQRSAFPERYDESEPKARELLAEARRRVAE